MRTSCAYRESVLFLGEQQIVAIDIQLEETPGNQC